MLDYYYNQKEVNHHYWYPGGSSGFQLFISPWLKFLPGDNLEHEQSYTGMVQIVQTHLLVYMQATSYLMI